MTKVQKLDILFMTKMAKIDALFMTKMPENPYPQSYIAHIREYPLGLVPAGCK